MKCFEVDVGVAGSSATLSMRLPHDRDQVRSTRRRPAIIVIPGGGYTHRSKREGEPVARCMEEWGFQTSVLNYSVSPAVYPQPLLELARAVSQLRARSSEFSIDAECIVVMGFSAGGHLAALLGAQWCTTKLWEPFGLKPADVRPDALVLGYPVITAGTYRNAASFAALTGGDTALARALSVELLVDGHMPPTFAWHTTDDASVPVQNSLLLAEALARASVSFSLHVFPHGAHGIALGTARTAQQGRSDHVEAQVQIWPQLAAAWIREQQGRRKNRVLESRF